MPRDVDGAAVDTEYDVVVVDEVGCLFADEAWAEDCGIEDGGCWRKAAKKLERKGRWGDMASGWRLRDLGDGPPRGLMSRRSGRVAAMSQEREGFVTSSGCGDREGIDALLWSRRSKTKRPEWLQAWFEASCGTMTGVSPGL